ncbi:mitochondrial ribosomal protein L42 [Dermatophagoides pteronyssinus]|uniref:Large ribosomal subunit protein mL42 n=1 Tax=Dermatophagoides pteronyssinus TaxID=6956 RepID=A0A6P6XZ27_DERPT|nr:39S ribosomal protein L42, mitochondrial-like [Dermatophagoides pteronyssinus]
MNSKWIKIRHLFSFVNQNNNSQRFIQNLYLSTTAKNNNDDDDPRITVTDDGKTIVCWHPEQPFPYEHSLPFVVDQSTQRLNSSALKIEILEKGENIYHKMPINRLEMEELRAITFTNKHNWRRRRFDGLQMRPAHPRKGV